MIVPVLIMHAATIALTATSAKAVAMPLLLVFPCLYIVELLARVYAEGPSDFWYVDGGMG